MASHKFTVDITAPEDGEILSGPYSAMVSKMFPYQQMVTILSTPPPHTHTHTLCTILGVDKGGECAMASHKFTVDITAPEDGEILSGPYSAMVRCDFINP